MNPLNEKILALFLAGWGLLLLVAADLMYRFNRKKAITATVLGLIFLVFAGYYVYLSCVVQSVAVVVTNVAPLEKPAVPPEQAATPPAETRAFSMVFDVDGQKVAAEADDEIQIKKNSRFVIKEVQANPPIPGLKANIVGFVANPRKNDGQDKGYTVSFGQLDKKKALKGNVFKVEFRDKETVLGNVYLKFVD